MYTTSNVYEQVIQEGVTSHISKTQSCNLLTQPFKVCNVWISLVTCMNESCHTYQSFISKESWHAWKTASWNLLTQCFKVCNTWQKTFHTYEEVIHQMRHKSFYTYGWVISEMSHFWNESCVISRIQNTLSYNALTYEKRHLTRHWHMKDALTRHWHMRDALTYERRRVVIQPTHPSASTSVQYEWIMAHIWMSHVTHMEESCHTYGWVMSHIWMSHVTHMEESCHTYGWVMSHIWMSYVTHMDESCHTYGWVMSHMWMSHVTHMNDFLLEPAYPARPSVWHINKVCRAYEWVRLHS